MNKIIISERQLTIDDFYHVVAENYIVELSDAAIDRIIKSREIVERYLAEGRVAYGITTGFGSLKDRNIADEDLAKLQYNLIRSHAVGVGEPSPKEIVRGMLLLRLCCFANGNSGVRLSTATKIVEALNKNYIPLVPIQGTVGASGDLAPLSHMVLGLMGEGKAFDFETNTYIDAKIVMERLAIEKIELGAKEGLALNNGTQFITSWAALSCYHASKLLKKANFVSAITIEALHGTNRAFDPRIHQSKPHEGQIAVAKEIRDILKPDGQPSEIFETYSKNLTQDAYSLRCIPQVHGPIHDTINFCKKIIETEMNGTNDNPLIFAATENSSEDVVSGGNFHGMYISMACDYLSIAMATLSNISERRLERMVNNSLNKFMPSFLTNNPGLNSGLMIVQYCSAALAAENRTIASPGSVHTIPTCEGTEDVVSMGGYSARKVYNSVENAYKVLSLEMFGGFQALEFTKEKPNKMVYDCYTEFRKNIPAVDDDVYMKDYIDRAIDFLKTMSI